MFEATLQLFDQYYRSADARNVAGFNRDLGCELRERLQQLQYIVERVRALEDVERNTLSRSQNALKQHVENLKRQGIAYESVPAPPETQITREEAQTAHRASFEMKLLTESFYYLAGRARTIIKNPRKPLPGLGSFECEGVRNVRNKLLEHAEGNDSQVSIQSFSSGGPRGPVLKALRYAGKEEVFPDRGLYANAEEFCSNLERVLRTQL